MKDESPINAPEPKRFPNRTPKLYRWADIGTEALIYFTVLWGPWAFGSVHDWAALTMNLANYAIGALLLTKWGIRYTTSYYPPRWTAQKTRHGPAKLQKRDWRTKAVAALTIYMLGYILVSILNVRATFNHEFNFFESFNDNYIKWLPHTHEISATTQRFLSFLGLACCFWGIRDWLLGKTSKENLESDEQAQRNWLAAKEYLTPSIPIRLNRLLWLLCISGGLLALIGIIQRLDGTLKLLWIYKRDQFGASLHSFGPFGYRSNGASYLNMILPISVGLLIWSINKTRRTRMQTGRKGGESHFILIPAICILIAAPFVSLSRGGLLVLGFLLFAGILIILFRPHLLRRGQRLGLASIMVVGISLSYYIGWEPLLKRLVSQDPWHETQIEKANSNETITYECLLPAPPYDRDLQLFMVTNSKKEKFREGFLNSTLYKNGNLEVLLYTDRTKSHIKSTFTNVTEHLETGFLKLKIERGVDGLSVHVNDTALKGIEKKSDPIAPYWSHPIIPNEVCINRKAAIKNGKPDLQTRILKIQPIIEKNGQSDLTKQSVEIDLEGMWSIKKLATLSSSRDRIYEDSLRMAKDYKWMGCGSGAWATVYFLYHDADEVWDAWVHCDWLEYWITFGFFGAIPGLLLMILTMSPNRKQWELPSISSIGVGLNLAIAGCLFHAMFDFPLQVISIMHLFVILCAVKMITGRKSNDFNTVR